MQSDSKLAVTVLLHIQGNPVTMGAPIHYVMSLRNMKVLRNYTTTDSRFKTVFLPLKLQ